MFGTDVMWEGNVAHLYALHCVKPCDISAASTFPSPSTCRQTSSSSMHENYVSLDLPLGIGVESERGVHFPSSGLIIFLLIVPILFVC